SPLPSPVLSASSAVDSPGSSGANSRVASDTEWGDAARRIAEGERMTAVAARLGCSRSTLWRTLQRSERLRTRIEEERRCLAVEAATRFKGLHGAALETIEAAVRRGDLRAAFWVADRLGLTKRELAEAREGLAMAEDKVAWGEAPPEALDLFALDTPLALEPEVRDELAGAASSTPKPAAAQTAEAAPATVGHRPDPRRLPPVSTARRRATLPQKCATVLHRTDPDLPSIEDLLRALPSTDAAWPDIQRQVATVHAAVFG